MIGYYIVSSRVLRNKRYILLIYHSQLQNPNKWLRASCLSSGGEGEFAVVGILLREIKGQIKWKAILRVWWGRDYTGVSYEHTGGWPGPIVTPAQNDLGVWRVEVV